MYIKHRSAGFTLVEVMIAAGLSSLLMLVMASFALYAARNCAALTNYASLETESRQALDRMTQQVRQARGLISCSTTNIILTDADGQPLEYAYDKSEKTLTRRKDGTATVLLTGCNYLRFDLFQRNPVMGSYNVYPAAAPATCKLIQISWKCARSLLGASVNSETVQSAKIVIRKKR